VVIARVTRTCSLSRPDYVKYHWRSLKLPEFWVADPVSWFAHVEAHFELENLESQQHRYFIDIKALGQDSLGLIKDIITNPHPTMPYQVLKDRLLNIHSLTHFQKIEAQFRIGELRPQQKPSELLAQLVELTPADELESTYLIFLFIQRLPRILRMQLENDLDLTYGMSQREPTAYSPCTPTTWQPQSPW
jgi:hypothetical protein